MSRIGKQPVPVPQGVDVAIDGGTIKVKGTNGELSWAWHPRIGVEYDADKRQVIVTRPNDQRQSRALHGLTRSLIENMVDGVQKHFEKRLEIQGVGYNATLAGQVLQLSVGYANTVRIPVPENVICEVPAPTQIVVKSMDKQACGQLAADIRSVRPPEPYKGKGIRYAGEHVRRKAGKALAGGGK
ncbi:MAG: 50S ribosomal protein L6 [Planctomycetes bacterium]|nr:50S ribosomal protein L6 [Planctomycetota bacterium]